MTSGDGATCAKCGRIVNGPGWYSKAWRAWYCSSVCRTNDKKYREKPHPVQMPTPHGGRPTASKDITLRAYEVYCAVYEPQPAMIEGGCRGGFSIGEIVAFLYARSFPRNEWRQRVDEAFQGLNLEGR